MQPRDGAHRLRELLLPHQRNRVDRDPLAADVVPVRLRDRALRHHAHLGPAADDDHTLAVDALKCRHARDLGDAFEPDQVRNQRCVVAGSGHLELQLRRMLAMGPAGDVRDIGAVLEDRLRDAVQNAGLVTRRHKKPQDLCIRHAEKITPDAG